EDVSSDGGCAQTEGTEPCECAGGAEGGPPQSETSAIAGEHHRTADGARTQRRTLEDRLKRLRKEEEVARQEGKLAAMAGEVAAGRKCTARSRRSRRLCARRNRRQRLLSGKLKNPRRNAGFFTRSLPG
ncbi:unnamed protein product, partial [Pylaiella littoralis]